MLSQKTFHLIFETENLKARHDFRYLPFRLLLLNFRNKTQLYDLLFAGCHKYSIRKQENTRKKNRYLQEKHIIVKQTETLCCKEDLMAFACFPGSGLVVQFS